MTVELLPLTADAPYFNQAVAVYSEYVTFGTMASHRTFFSEHTQRRDYHGLAACCDGQIVGLAFGSRSQRGEWWHDKVAHRVGAKHPALQSAWVLTQLNVLAAYRNQGVGARLHDAILAQQPYHKLLLSTPVANAGAQRFYRRRGWHVLHSGFVFSNGDEPYAIFHKTLEPTQPLG